MKIEIQVITLFWFLGEVTINAMTKFRMYHIFVIMKFLIVWGLFHSLFQPRAPKNDRSKKYDMDFDKLKEKGGLRINQEIKEDEGGVRRYLSDNL